MWMLLNILAYFILISTLFQTIYLKLLKFLQNSYFVIYLVVLDALSPLDGHYTRMTSLFVKQLGLAVDELLLALWMIFWRGLVSFAVEPFDSCILKPLLPLTGILETVSIFITVSLGEVGCFSNLNYNQNSLNNSAQKN